MATDTRIDPYRGFNYIVEINNAEVAAFSEVSGLTAEGDSADYREGNEPENHVRKLTGLRKYSNLTLKRGYTKNDLFWKWYANIASGQDDRRQVTVILRNEAHENVMSWIAENTWINKIEGPSLNATGNEIAVESIELVPEKITMELE